MKKIFAQYISMLLIALFFISGCASNPASDQKLNVVASTTLVADVVKQIGGDKIEVTGIFPVGADPHTFEPRPQDAAAIANATVVFLNGLELEHSLEPLIDSNATGEVVEVSDGIEVLPFSEEHADTDAGDEDHVHQAGDPHTWMDPNLVMIWTDNIAAALSKADPQNASFYEENAIDYKSQLSDLDTWIISEVEKIPQENRKLVTDHENMGYFVHRYGFTLVGLVVESLSTGASPSAQELSQLEDMIRQQSVKSVFVGSTVNPALSEQVANDTGAQLIVIDTESLGEASSDTATYIQFMKTMVSAIVTGLK